MGPCALLPGVAQPRSPGGIQRAPRTVSRPREHPAAVVLECLPRKENARSRWRGSACPPGPRSAPRSGRAGGGRGAAGTQRCSASPTMRQTQFNTTPRHHSTCPVGRTGQAGQPTVAVVGRPWSVPAGAAPGRAVSVACPQPADHSAAFCEFVVRHAHPQEK